MLKFMSVLVVLSTQINLLQGQSMSALETAELGVNTLLETAIESKSLFLTDREQYFENDLWNSEIKKYEFSDATSTVFPFNR